MTSIRLPVSFFLSSITTVALFWFLAMLIATEPLGGIIPVVPAIQIGRVIVDTPVETKPRIKPIPKPPPPDPSPIAFREPKLLEPEIVDPSKLVPEFTGPGELGKTYRGDPEIAHRGGADRGPVPQIRIEPDYPPQARDRGLEGFVTFRFTVTKEGRVKDIEIVDSEPQRIWDSATIRAVSSWKYQPALKDGAPVEQVGLMATYRFELER